MSFTHSSTTNIHCFCLYEIIKESYTMSQNYITVPIWNISSVPTMETWVLWGIRISEGTSQRQSSGEIYLIFLTVSDGLPFARK